MSAPPNSKPPPQVHATVTEVPAGTPDPTTKPAAILDHAYDPDSKPPNPPHPNQSDVGLGLGEGGGGGSVLPRADTELSWGAPAGLHIRGVNDENLVIFRRAVGINSTLAGSIDAESLEEGRRKAVGIYAAALNAVRRKTWSYHCLSWLINACHFVQIIIGASLTALGPSAGSHVVVITLLGAINTVVAGVLALIKGQGLPDRLYHDRAEYRRLQDWIEQTEALLAVGIIGRDRKEVGVLVQTAFKKYNAAMQCVESNLPENYTHPPESDQLSMAGSRKGSPSPSGHQGRSPSPYHQ